MNVLVTGAAGFAGRYLVEYLLERDETSQVFALARQPTDQDTLDPRVVWVGADLRDAGETMHALETSRPDVIYHLAGHAAAAGDRTEVFRSNVDATLNLLGAAGRIGRPVRVMLASSGYVYGACEEDVPATEETSLRPTGVYAESKAEMERRALAGEWGNDVTVIVARAFNHTGPRQPPAFAVPTFAQQLAAIEAGQAEPVLRVGNLASRRDLGDVRDVVRGYVALTSNGSHGECFNVCTGRWVRMSDVLATLVAMCRARVTVTRDLERMRALDLPLNYGSPRKLESRTGWRAEIGLTQTLRDTLEWSRRSLQRS